MRKGQRGFALEYLLLAGVIIVVAAVAVTLALTHHNKTNTPTNTTSNSQSSNNKPQATQQYLDVKEWGVKMPLSSAISDAYYVVSTGSKDSNGQPDTVWLGIKSLDNVGNCNANKSNTGGGIMTSIVRVLPDKKDPVSGELYTQGYPDGTTIDGYYYGYSEGIIKNNPCTTDPSYQTKLQNINAAFAKAAKNIVAD